MDGLWGKILLEWRMTAGTPISANHQMVSEAKRIRDPIKLHGDITNMNLGMARCYLPEHGMTQQPSSKATHETHGHISGFLKKWYANWSQNQLNQQRENWEMQKTKTEPSHRHLNINNDCQQPTELLCKLNIRRFSKLWIPKTFRNHEFFNTEIGLNRPVVDGLS